MFDWNQYCLRFRNVAYSPEMTHTRGYTYIGPSKSWTCATKVSDINIAWIYEVVDLHKAYSGRYYKRALSHMLYNTNVFNYISPVYRGDKDV